jgi:hypothetical protein
MFYDLFTRAGSRKHLVAHQFTGNNATLTNHLLCTSNHDFQYRIVGSHFEYDVPTLTGIETVTNGDWIVINKNGELEVFTPTAFAAYFKFVGKKIDLE